MKSKQREKSFSDKIVLFPKKTEISQDLENEEEDLLTEEMLLESLEQGLGE